MRSHLAAASREVRRALSTASHSTLGVPPSVHLPSDVLADQARRLCLFSAVALGSWAFGLVVDSTMSAFMPGGPRVDLWKSQVVECGGIACSLLMWSYLLWGRPSDERKIDAGLVYLVFNAVLVALLNTWVVVPQTTPTVQPSWNVVLVLTYALVVPATRPRRMLAGALVAASLDPVAVWLAHLRGVPTPSLPQVAIGYLPNYMYACVSVVPSFYLRRIGLALARARELGSYELVEKLGTGGMGEVWRARHRLLARDAAIKLIRPDRLDGHADSTIALGRFEREAQATAALTSPHTIRLFDFGLTDDGALYYAMELLEGRDLESLVRQFGPLPPERVIHLVRQMCKSLAEAHAHGLIHRDVKPANVYVCHVGLEFDFVKVLDFGLVRHESRAGTATGMTGHHMAMGTPGYIAPEAILGDRQVDRRVDVYAVGCVAYFLLTGEQVFDGNLPLQQLIQHVHADPVPPSQRTELLVPAALDELVLMCLRKQPERRPDDARTLLQLIDDCDVNGWNQRRAEAWWEAHLPEFVKPTMSGVVGETSAQYGV